MTSLATKFMEKRVKKYASVQAADILNPKQQFINDPEIKAAQEEAAKTTKRHWWKRQQQPDIILSERDRQVLRAVKRRATYLDKGCSCCCFSFGFDFIIGLIPGVGDAIGLILGLELIKVASRADLPKHIQIQMVINAVMDFLIGLTPFVGDLLDAVIKSNWRNAMILEDYLMLRRRDEIRIERGHHNEPSGSGTSNEPAQQVDLHNNGSPPIPNEHHLKGKPYGSFLPRF
ncbi:uncharacterized protein BX664DRAFT_331293 [Halteromyces radiatus]|uniref:uncharacterized protein n=1 Tax=Halteromyces radiatus TaxID=101107 RepID=UPI00221FAB22|nr:uncharacterized protein BX664DRAFT_331293 [Halteromyces radiatus]KAI8088755.1 hypothetical protein BX664DRAFT_331293 [Halteromyces radiatus]